MEWITPELANSVGLILDAGGAFFFAKGIFVSDETLEQLQNLGSWKFNGGTDYFVEQGKRDRRDGIIGFILFLTGFILQLVSQFT